MSKPFIGCDFFFRECGFPGKSHCKYIRADFRRDYYFRPFKFLRHHPLKGFFDQAVEAALLSLGAKLCPHQKVFVQPEGGLDFFRACLHTIYIKGEDKKNITKIKSVIYVFGVKKDF